MFLPRLVLYAFEDERDLDRSERASLRVLWALVDINLDWLREHPETPYLYQSGLRYDPQAYHKGQEDWLDIPTALATCTAGVCWGEKERGARSEEGGARGRGTDCKVLVAYRVAELRHHGIDARPWLLRQSMRPTLGGKIDYGYHVVVRWPDGTLEDPSKVLGMR